MAFFAMPPVLANATGYIVGFVFSFLLHRHYTFRSNIGVYKGMISYLVIVAGAYMANILALLGSINLLSVNAYVGQGLGVAVYVLLTFIGSSKFVFNRDAL